VGESSSISVSHALYMIVDEPGFMLIIISVDRYEFLDKSYSCYDTQATSVVYFHRFFMLQSFKQFNRWVSGNFILRNCGHVLSDVHSTSINSVKYVMYSLSYIISISKSFHFIH